MHYLFFFLILIFFFNDPVKQLLRSGTFCAGVELFCLRSQVEPFRCTRIIIFYVITDRVKQSYSAGTVSGSYATDR